LQNQSVLYVQSTLAAEPRVLLDPNTLAKDGTVALTATAVSQDGKWLAYGTAAAGSDWNEFRVRSVATGEDAADVIKWVKFSGLAWTRDSKGFFYSRYDEPAQSAEGNGKTFGALANQKVQPPPWHAAERGPADRGGAGRAEMVRDGHRDGRRPLRGPQPALRQLERKSDPPHRPRRSAGPAARRTDRETRR
jgi:hypothetical protein